MCRARCFVHRPSVGQWTQLPNVASRTAVPNPVNLYYQICLLRFRAIRCDEFRMIRDVGAADEINHIMSLSLNTTIKIAIMRGISYALFANATGFFFSTFAFAFAYPFRVKLANFEAIDGTRNEFKI